MAFDVSGLNTFRDEFSSELTSKVILESETLLKLGNIDLYPNIKAGSELKLNHASQTISPRAAGCSFNASSGETSLSQETITPKAFQDDQNWCPQDLSPKYLAQKMKGSTHQEDFTESQFIFELVSKEIKKFNDAIIWTGDTDDGDLIDGILTKLEDDADRVNLTVDSGLTYTLDNTYDIVYDMYEKFVQDLPELINQDDLVLLTSNAVFASFTKALRDANLFNYGQHNDAFKTGIIIPGTNVTIMPLNGLGNDWRMILTKQENLVIVMDGVSDEEGMDVWYSKDNQEIRGVSKWTLGSGYHFGDNIVTNF